VSDDPEKRARSLANLKRGKKSGSLQEIIETEKKLKDLDIISFCEKHIYLPEKRKTLIKLEGWEKEIMKDCFYDHRPRMIVISVAKKNGKSTLASAILTWFLNCQEPGEIYVCSNSKDQSNFVTFRKIVKMVQKDPELAKMCRVYADYIENTKTDTILRCLPSSFRSSAGLNCLCICIDELSSFDTDSLKFFFDELQLSPIYKYPLILITSTAGREESGLLWDLIKASEKGNTEENYFYIRSGAEANPSSFVTQKYLDSQRNKPSMRENLFKRLHKNLWVSEEDSFITDQDFRNCLDYSLVQRPKSKMPVWVGLDVGVKNDWTGIVSVAKKGDKIISVDHKAYIPEGELNFDEVRDYIVGLSKRYYIEECLFDPYQAVALAQELRKKGVNMVELPQTQSNCISFSQNLYNLIRDKKINFYESEEIRISLINCKVVYSGERGWRITKRKSSKKIDLAIALAEAVFGATRADDSVCQIRWIGRGTTPIEEARKERRRAWIEGDDDFDDIPEGNIGIGRNRLIGW